MEGLSYHLPTQVLWVLSKKNSPYGADFMFIRSIQHDYWHFTGAQIKDC